MFSFHFLPVVYLDRLANANCLTIPPTGVLLLFLVAGLPDLGPLSLLAPRQSPLFYIAKLDVFQTRLAFPFQRE